jgi:hypothetical protein
MEINKNAMTHLKNNRFNHSHQTLKLAEKKLNNYKESDNFIENDLFLNAASITYNNLGCYFQK